MHRLHAAFAAWVAVPVLFLSGLPAHAQPPAQPYRVSTNVDLVLLNAAVRDRKGLPVSGLREQDFAVYENGVRQAIRVFQHEDIPVTVGLVVDHSGSMRPKMASVIAAARTFVRFSNPEDEMFVVNFNEYVTLGLPAGTPFTNRSDELARAISTAPAAGRTALYDAVARAQERLKAGSREKKALLVISDGGDNASSHTLAEVLQTAGRSSALVYTIGIFDDDDADRNPDALKRLAQAAGGEAYFPRRFDEVGAICERIARDIREQYTLGYLSANALPDGAYRTIRVDARDPNGRPLSVRARSGYKAAGEAAR